MGLKRSLYIALGAILLFSTMANAAEKRELDGRVYITPMVNYGLFGDDTASSTGTLRTDVDFDKGIGGTLILGKAIAQQISAELFADYFDGIDEDSGGNSTDIQSYGLSMLFFPFRQSETPLFGLVGFGAGKYDNPDIRDGDTAFLDFGVGYVYKFTNYRFGIRAEYRYRTTEISIDNSPDPKIANHIFSLGLQIPLGAPPPPPEEPKAEPAPTPVAPPAPEPLDSDGDGVLDPDDDCPGTPAGTKVDAKGCPIEKAAPIVLKGVTFEFNSDKLTADATRRLDNVVNALQSSSDINVSIEGHTDSKGTDSYNMQLSDQRAASVRRYLTQHGIDGSRLSSKGFGESQPVAPNTNSDGSDNPEGRAKNRRVELKVKE